MDKDNIDVTQKILNLTLKIIYLLTGEDCMVVKKKTGECFNPKSHPLSSGSWRQFSESNPLPPSLSLIPKSKNVQKILEVTQEIINLLAGEVPIRCQDVSVYFSMEEWEYLEGHKDLYKDIAMMEDQPPLTSPDGSSNRNPPERCPRPLFQESTQEGHTIHHHDQGEELKDIKVEIKEEEEEILVSEVPQSMDEGGTNMEMKQEEPSLQINTNGCYFRNTSERSRDHLEDIGISDTSHVVPPDIQLQTIGVAADQFTPHLLPSSLDNEVADLDNSLVSCLKCGKSFMDRFELRVHLRSHTRVTFTCTDCGECFNEERELLTHQKSNTCEDPFSCSECGKSFSSKASLNIHWRTHTGERPFSCSECGKRFPVKESLLVHQRSHTGERPFSCSECGKRFTTKGSLVVHQRSHTGERPHACSECGKSFTTKGNLVKHQMSHTGERPHSCPDCGKSFTAKADVLRHLRMHTGQRPFSCSECGKTFAEKANLVMHQKIHSGERPYSCSECGKCFKGKREVKRHERTHAR